MNPVIAAASVIAAGLAIGLALLDQNKLGFLFSLKPGAFTAQTFMWMRSLLIIKVPSASLLNLLQ